MLPRPLIEEFWNQVASIVKRKCHLSEDRAFAATSRFRNDIEPKTGEMIYHDNVENVAETIANAVRSGEYSSVERKGA